MAERTVHAAQRPNRGMAIGAGTGISRSSPRYSCPTSRSPRPWACCWTGWLAIGWRACQT